MGGNCSTAGVSKDVPMFAVRLAQNAVALQICVADVQAGTVKMWCQDVLSTKVLSKCSRTSLHLQPFPEAKLPGPSEISDIRACRELCTEQNGLHTLPPCAYADLDDQTVDEAMPRWWKDAANEWDRVLTRM